MLAAKISQRGALFRQQLMVAAAWEKREKRDNCSSKI